VVEVRSLSKTTIRVAAALLASLALSSASSEGAEDLDFQAEHMLESAMNDRLTSFLTTSDEIEPERWSLAVGVGAASARSSAFSLEGGMLSAAAAYGLAEGGGLELTGFYDRFNLSGSGGSQVLDPRWSTELPLQFPVDAETSDPRGEVSHLGAGLAWVKPAQGKHRRRWRFGLFYSRVEVKDFAVDYRLLAAPEVSGRIDYSATYDYLWPWSEVEARWDLGSRWRVVPHAGAFLPLPGRGFAGRMSGPGFDISGDTDTALGDAHMGDAHVALGLRFDHRPTGLSVDLGGSLFNLLAEPIDHPGIDTAIVLQLVWRYKGRADS
jgi:hypothetical protein